MFENIMNFFKNLVKREKSKESSDTAKERLHLVLMQDRANVSADFLELMKQEIIEVIKKYIDVDEKEIDVHLTNKANEDGTVGAPALYANIPIVTIKNEARKVNVPNTEQNEENKLKEEQENSNIAETTSKKDEKDTETTANEPQEEKETKIENEQTQNENTDINNEPKNNVEENEEQENKKQKLEDNISEQTEQTTSNN